MDNIHDNHKLTTTIKLNFLAKFNAIFSDIKNDIQLFKIARWNC